GDVSCVAYELDYQDPINGSNDQYSTFTFYRLLVNPDKAFESLLGKPELETAFQAYRNQVTDVENFVCENVFQFSMTFHIEVVKNAGTAEATKMTVPVTMGPTAGGGRITSFRVLGTGLELDSAPSSNVTVDELRAGRLAAMEVSLTVISDFGLRQMQNSKIKGKALQKLMARNSFQYSKLVELPGM
ncbi:MAG: hypothetical protein K9M97_07970, partial [Akkermansiaceae bacterium]|nr:hypothetical protein [Akkermansiaceae bacterium]